MSGRRRALAAAIAVAVLAALPAGAQPAASQQPRFERRLLPQGSGPGWAAVDAPLLAGGRPLVYQHAADPATWAFESGLEDLRLFDAAGREVPYLLVASATASPRLVTGRLQPVAATKKTSGFEVDLGAPALVDRLALRGLPAPFLKRFTLEGSGDRQRWTLLTSEGTLFDLPDERLRQTAVDFEAGEYRYLRLTWDDRSSGRLPMPAGVEARLPGAVPSPSRERIDLEFERRPSEPGKSRFRLRLPGPHLPLAAIEIEAGGEHLLREARVTEARLAAGARSGGGGEVLPVPLGSAMLRRVARQGVAAEELAIAIQPPEGAELELVVDDGDNPPLDLAGVRGIFAPLPWVYFESPDGAPLTARFGSPEARAPRYDLEALRGRVSRAAAPQARWEPVSETEAAAPGPPAELRGAPLAASGFRYRRDLPSTRPELNALALDAAVLAHSRPGLADVRLADGEGHQVPYLLETRDEPLMVGLGLEPASDGTSGVSWYRLTLPYPGLPTSRLVLATRARVFERRVVVEEAPVEAGRTEELRQLAAGRWRHVDPETPAPALVLELPALSGDAMMVMIDDGDNSPLPLEPPKLLLPAWRLRFFGGQEGLALFYGQPGLAAARYDLALLAPRLVGAAAHEIEPGPEVETGTTPARRESLVFWGALIAAVAALLVLLARLLRRSA